MKGIKNILKKILPIPLLKELFLVYNKIKILTIDKIIFPEYIIPNDQFLVYRKGFPFVESKVHLKDLPLGKARTYMQAWYEWTQEEFILVFKKKCWIEPDYGWAIVEPNRLVYYSLGVSRTWFQQKPGFFEFWRRKEIIRTSKGISLRDPGEENYFHFFNDLVAKLFFLQQHDINVKDFPVIVSAKAWEKPYFQYYLKYSTFLQSLDWIVQNRQYIQCDNIIFCKPLTHRLDLWNDILSPLRKISPSHAHRKFFITRSKSRLRFIENSEAVTNVCNQFGLEVIDTDDMLPEQQVEIFSQASLIVGIHGAGLTNMIFRDRDCSILEIFPPPDLGYLPYHYVLLACMKGFRYRAIIGEKAKIPYSGGFHLNILQFERELRNL